MEFRNEQKPDRMNRRDRKKYQQEQVHKQDLQRLEKAFGEKLNLQEKAIVEKVQINVQNREKYRKPREERQDLSQSFTIRDRARRGRGRGGYRSNPYEIFIEERGEKNQSQSKEEEIKFQKNKAQFAELNQKEQRQYKPKNQRVYRDKGQKWENHHHKHFKDNFEGQKQQFQRGENYKQMHRQREHQEGGKIDYNNERGHRKHRGHRQEYKQERQFKGRDYVQVQRERNKHQQQQQNDIRQPRAENRQEGYHRQDRKKHYEDKKRQRGDRQERRYNKRQQREFVKDKVQNSQSQPLEKVKKVTQPKKQTKPVEHPEYLLCPITQLLMQSPYLLAVCGHTFEQNVIRQWLIKQQKCPLCNKPAQVEHLVKNFALAQVCRSVR